jgi:hypothetical protein|tara:strand:- start:5631 stop:5942 length:312 start_codon:yes stop_codon:yes gene_type:complete
MWWITVFIVVFFTIIILLSLYSTEIKGSFLKKDLAWPPYISKCPDYWELNEKDMICKSNNINIGENTDDCKSFVPYNEDMSQEEKDSIHQKARVCDISWHGVY